MNNLGLFSSWAVLLQQQDALGQGLHYVALEVLSF